MRTRRLYLWNEAPALRLLCALVPGIVVQWYVPFQMWHLIVGGSTLIFLLLLWPLLPPARQFVLKPFYGLLLMLLVAIAGAGLVWLNYVTNDRNWIGHHYTSGQAVLLQLDEPPVEKKGSYKANAFIKAVKTNDGWQPAKGKTIIYFKKEATFATLDYGAQLVTAQPLQPIKNSGNPGAFDYRRYTFFPGHHAPGVHSAGNAAAA